MTRTRAGNISDHGETRRRGFAMFLHFTRLRREEQEQKEVEEKVELALVELLN